MEELAKQIVNKMNLDEIVNTMNSEIEKVDCEKKDELYLHIVEEIQTQLNKKVQ